MESKMSLNPCPNRTDDCAGYICNICHLCASCCDPTVDDMIHEKSKLTYEQGIKVGETQEHERIVAILKQVLDPFDDLPLVLRAIETSQQ